VRYSPLVALLGYYLARGHAVLHFLNIKGLALQGGIPVDGDPEALFPPNPPQAKKPAWRSCSGLLLAGRGTCHPKASWIVSITINRFDHRIGR
jgi:hypothetical protein